jgi:hypothetical protein
MIRLKAAGDAGARAFSPHGHVTPLATLLQF